MKNIFRLFFLLPITVFAQTTTENYVKTKVYKKATATRIANPSPDQALQQITYLNGFGKPIQQIINQQSGLGKNIVIPIEYDALGRQAKKYLPYPNQTTGLDYESNATSDVLNYPPYLGQNPYSETLYEDSALGRVIKEAAPGPDWAMGSGHEIKSDYKTNSIHEVKLFDATALWSASDNFYDIALNVGTYYDENTLYKIISKNENWTNGNDNTIESFKDKSGRLVLKRMYDGAETIDTYYVYDQFGNLTYIIPPIASDITLISPTDLDNLCYQYKYDQRNRMVAKKLPGKQWQFIVYNLKDMPIATGPALNPWGDGTQGWLITKYDIFGRIVYNGWKQDTVDSASRIAFQGLVGTAWAEGITNNNIDGVEVSYTNDVYPQSFSLLSVFYYDNYTHAFGPTVPTSVLGQSVKTNLKGLLTGSWVRVLTIPSETSAEVQHIFYNDSGKVIRSVKNNYLGGYTTIDSKLTFTGKPEYSMTYHKRIVDSPELKVEDNYEYNPQDRLVVHKQKINNLPEQLIAKNDYNQLGQLITKQVGGEDVQNYVGLQKVDYEYNIRGWLKSINNVDNLSESNNPTDLFAFKINYNQINQNPMSAIVNPLYNGNISETFWRTNSDNILRKYGYQYDGLNRLKKAIYQKPNANYPVTNMYNEFVDYDKNGNIQNLQRNGDLDDPSATNAIEIDDLKYSYDPDKKNQLIAVKDLSTHPNGFLDGENSGDDYAYDENGNLTKDLNKGINFPYSNEGAIKYNQLNLPVEINFASGNKINYIYNAFGQKIKKIVNENVAPPNEAIPNISTTETDYLDGYQYTGGALNFFPQAEGYVKVTQCPQCMGNQQRYNYVYNYLDHLGNVRVSYGYDTQNNALKILEDTNYYPFGLKHTRYNTSKKQYQLENGELSEVDPPGFSAKISIVPNNGSNLLNKYKFQGQERQDELGLNWDSFKWRNYDPAIGRFMCIDPLAEKYNWQSSYVFGSNQVVHSRELEGLEAYDDLDQCDLDFEAHPAYGTEIITKEGDQYHQPEFDLDEVVITKGLADKEEVEFDDYSNDYSSSNDSDGNYNEGDDFELSHEDVKIMAISLIIVGSVLTATGAFAEVGLPLMEVGDDLLIADTVEDDGKKLIEGNLSPTEAIEDTALIAVPMGYDSAFGKEGFDYLMLEMGAAGTDYWFELMNELHP